MKNHYQIIVIGGGPGGYTAALYAARAGLSTLIIEKMAAGGQMTETTQIDNYPGFDEGIDGFTLGMKMQSGAERFGAETLYAEVLEVSLKEQPKRIVTPEGEFLADAVIIATGAGHRYLGVSGEEKLVGRGVAYCAACDGMFYRGREVAVIGGGNSAVADALLLSRVAKKVHLIHRRDSLRATRVYHKALEEAENLQFHWNSAVTGFLGEDALTGITVQDLQTGEERELALDGVFVSIGRNPATALFREQLPLDDSGYIIADESTRTAIPGVFAVGDVRTKALRQIITAAADGAVAVHYAEEFIAAEA